MSIAVFDQFRQSAGSCIIHAPEKESTALALPMLYSLLRVLVPPCTFGLSEPSTGTHWLVHIQKKIPRT